MSSRLSRFRAEFPIAEEWSYLDAAAYGPHPRRYVDALATYSQRLTRERYFEVADDVQRVRDTAARLMRAPARNVALLRSTGEGMNLLASGLEWEAGDEVILYEYDFPSVLSPFLALGARGVVARVILDDGRDRFDVEDVERLLGPRTRAVALSLVNPYHGFRAQIEDIASICSEHGVWLAVDAVQALGVSPVDVPRLGADVVAAHAYKFLLGGFGYALAYCSDRALRELTAPHVGAVNLQWERPNASAFAGPTLFETGLALRPDARRFEPGMASIPAVMGLGASLELLEEAGMEAVAEHVGALADTLADGLSELGWQVPNREAAGRTTIISAVGGGDVHATHRALVAARVQCSVRRDRLRFAPHLYNSLADAEAALAALRRQS